MQGKGQQYNHKENKSQFAESVFNEPPPQPQQRNKDLISPFISCFILKGRLKIT